MPAHLSFIGCSPLAGTLHMPAYPPVNVANVPALAALILLSLDELACHSLLLVVHACAWARAPAACSPPASCGALADVHGIGRQEGHLSKHLPTVWRLRSGGKRSAHSPGHVPASGHMPTLRGHWPDLHAMRHLRWGRARTRIEAHFTEG